MTPEEQKEFELLSQRAEYEQAKRMQADTQVAQMSSFQAGKEPNIIEYQLDVSPILDRIYHLLSGHMAVRLSNGSEQWQEPDDDRLKILSVYGVKEIMIVLSHYISPGTLLGDIDEDEQYRITREFGGRITDLMYNRYEHFFYYPSPEELFETYKPIADKMKLDMTPEELYEKCCEWSDAELQSKFRHFDIIIESLVHQVFMALSRALNGQERDSLRKQYNIHQSLNSPTTPVPQKGFLGGGKVWGK